MGFPFFQAAPVAEFFRFMSVARGQVKGAVLYVAGPNSDGRVD